MNENQEQEQAVEEETQTEWERILSDAMKTANSQEKKESEQSVDQELAELQALLDNGLKPDPLEKLVQPESVPLTKKPRPEPEEPTEEEKDPEILPITPAPLPEPPKEIPKEPQKPDRFRKFRKNQYWLLGYLWLTLVFSEVLVRATTVTGRFFDTGLWLTPLFALVPALLVFGIATIVKKPKINQTIVIVYSALVYLLYASQFIYFKIFKVFYTPASMGNAKQGFGFMSTILKTLGEQFLILLILLIPLAFLLVWGKKFFSFRGGATLASTGLLAGVLVVAHVLTVVILPIFGGTGSRSAYDMYHHAYDIKDSTVKLGLGTSFRLNTKWHLFGAPKAGGLTKPDKPDKTEATDPMESTVLPGEVMESTEPGETLDPNTPVVPPLEEYNKLDFDFDVLVAGEGDSDIRDMHEYFGDQTPTKKNSHTGMFEGCNLILLTCESWSYLSMSPEKTPTLWKMKQEGINFTNFYTPIWGVSTSDGEYVALTSTIPEANTWSFQDSADNYMPTTMVAQLKDLGYCAYAYHNHDYEYYYRHESHPNLGYIYEGYGNGIEEGVTQQWPESDVEMIDFTVQDYIDKQPFHAYYMTVSGHMNYNFEGGNAMCMKHMDEVEDLKLSDPCRAYIACNMEVDQAMELLLQKLEAAGIAENTVIVLTADHYPYGLTLEQMSELAGHEIDEYFEMYKNECIIYKKGMTPETVDRLCCSMDLLPTLANLFGLDFDSRLYQGHDMFSEADPLVIFRDRSWMTDKARYNAANGEFEVLTDEKLPEDYESTIDDIVRNKFTISAMILDHDYWRHLFAPETLEN